MRDIPLHETKIHGTVAFPFIVYPGRIPEFITTFPRHWHEEAELIYVTDGTLQVTVWSESFQMNAGDIVILLPQTIHSLAQAVKQQSIITLSLIFLFSAKIRAMINT